MAKSNLYTKGGDTGQTSLVSGKRVPKSSIRINAYGEVDELNSSLGMIIALFTENELLKKELNIIHIMTRVQHNLFSLGSRLACENELWDKYKLPKINFGIIESVEKLIDELDSSLPVLKEFILPGGSSIAAQIHITRTVCRRVERSLVSLANEVELPDNGLMLLNRFSDFLFILGRYTNSVLGLAEEKWQAE